MQGIYDGLRERGKRDERFSFKSDLSEKFSETDWSSFHGDVVGLGERAREEENT